MSQEMPLQETPEEPTIADDAGAPIQEVHLEEPLPPDEGTPDQVVPDPVPMVKTPVEEQISDEAQQIPVDETPLESST